MDCDLNFNSDSTYCSLYENTGQTIKGKYKASYKIKESKVLDIIHNEVLLHWEGKRLIGRIQAQKYMKQISKMKMKSYKDQYFAEKIQSSLFKIFNLAKEFEKSFSLNHNTEMSDPIKDCSFSQDIKFMNNEADDPKQILLGTTNVNIEKSFPLDLLTNNNFVSCNSVINNTEMKTTNENCVDKDKTENERHKNLASNIVSSQDMFASENSQIFEEHCSSGNTGSILYGSEVLNSYEPESQKCVSDISNEIIIDEVSLPQSFGKNIPNRDNYSCKVKRNTFCPSQGVALVEYVSPDVSSSTHIESKFQACNNGNDNIVNNEMYNNQIISHNFIEIYGNNLQQVAENVVNEEYIDVMAKILNITVGEKPSFIETSNFSKTEVSETLLFDENRSSDKVIGNSVKTINIKNVMELGNVFNESYNKRINKLCYGTGNESKSWQEIQKELECGENLARTVTDTLNGLFEKLCLEECECAKKQFGEKSDNIGNLHNFSLEDAEKFDAEDLFKKNKAKLEMISEEFRRKLDMEQMTAIDNEDDDDDYEGLDWRKLIN